MVLYKKMNMNTRYEERKKKDYKFVAFGKKWKSIAQCCDYYGIEYHSVMQYKSDNRCNTETALQKYIDYKKNNFFYFRKKKWSSMKECCDFYGINYKSFIACKKNWELPAEDAMKKYIRMDKDRKFIFNGITYNSFADCCHAHSVNPVLVERFRRKNKLLRRRALIGYLKYKEEKADAETFCFANISYHTFTECCNRYGLKAPLLRAFAKRNDVSLYSALVHYIITNIVEVPPSENIDKDILMPITYKEIYYQSVILCCEVLSIDIEQVCQMKEISKRCLKDIICELDQKNIRMEREQVKSISNGFLYKKTYYPSIGICCKILGLNEHYVYSRLWREGETIESVLDFYLKSP